MKSIVALIAALPEILRLIRNIEKRLDERATQKKIKQDIEKLNKAFEENDAEAINRIFNSN